MSISLSISIYMSISISIYIYVYTYNLITKTSCQAWLKLLITNQGRLGGPGGGADKTDHFEADVPGGNCVTVGFDSPLVRPSTCIGGEGQNIRKAMEEVEKIEVRLSKAV